VRERDRHARHRLRQHRADGFFVDRIRHRPQQTHGNRLNLALLHRRDDGPHRRDIQLQHDVAFGTDPLRYLERQMLRHVRRRKFRCQLQRIHLAALPIHQDVRKALRHQERRARGLTFDDGIGRARGAVDQHGCVAHEVLERHAHLVGGIADGRRQAGKTPLRRGQRLADGQPAFVVRDHHVGERAAGVNRDAIHALPCLACRV
jgi:hypothetical protein